MIDADVRVLTDENVHPEVVSFLRAEGKDVRDVKEDGWTGIEDVKIIHRAEEEQRVIVTHDRDFGQLLIAQARVNVGIIYLRPGHIDPRFTIETLQALFQYDRPDPPFIVVAERQKQRVNVRIRTLS
jgi:predicted nuclease of predicted toxin-antitoxin system